MDADRFDALARAVGRTTTRRRLLRTLVAGMGTLLGTANPSLGTGSAASVCDVASCTELVQKLHKDCVKACKKEKEAGSGACILACELDYYLSLRTCRRTGGCTEVFTHCCGGACLDVRADPNHCGSCDTRCPPGQPCCDGSCRGDDAANCGSCGNTCPRSESGPGHCVGGQCHRCGPAETECPSGGAIFCVDLRTSPSSCGACGAACPGDRVCCDGKCTAGVARCGGTCVSNACPPERPFDQATCRCACPRVECEAGKSQDPATCACVCPTPCPAGYVRDGHTCRCSCSNGTTDCAGRCVDLLVDSSHCGSCGHPCIKGRTCRRGTCACPPDKPDICNGVCTTFDYDPGSCGGCGEIYVCPGKPPFGLPHCCPGNPPIRGICTDVHFDGQNCGACGHVCHDGTYCNSGRCVEVSTRQGAPGITLTCPSGGSCGDFPPCDPDTAGCACMTSTEQTGVCTVNGPCDDLPRCLASANCGPGSACVADNCCTDGLPRCLPLCTAGG
jgi:hypothetical protein